MFRSQHPPECVCVYMPVFGVQPRLRAKHRTRGKGLPGWGSVPNPEDWRVIDEMEDEGTGAGAGERMICLLGKLIQPFVCGFAVSCAESSQE